MSRDPMTDDERWQAVEARDKAFDGRFVTGVLTTGIYCRPSCAAAPSAKKRTFSRSGCRAAQLGRQ